MKRRAYLNLTAGWFCTQPLTLYRITKLLNSTWTMTSPTPPHRAISESWPDPPSLTPMQSFLLWRYETALTKAAVSRGVGSFSAEGSVRLWSCSEDSPVRFGLICQFSLILLPQLCCVTVWISSKDSGEWPKWSVYGRPHKWSASGPLP